MIARLLELPDCLLMSISKYLSLLEHAQANRICKYLRDRVLTSGCSLHEHLVISSGNKRATQCWLYLESRVDHQLQSISFPFPQLPRAVGIVRLFQTLSTRSFKLQHLQISVKGLQSGKSTLGRLNQCFPNLTSLHLGRVDGISMQVIIQGIKGLQLTSLTLHRVQSNDTQHLTTLIRSQRRLTSLNLTSSNPLIKSNQLLEHISTLTDLVQLNLNNSCQRLTDDGVRHLSHLPHLTRLCLDDSLSKLTANSLMELSSLRRLKVLQLPWMDPSAHAGLKALRNNLRIEQLSLHLPLGSQTSDILLSFVHMPVRELHVEAWRLEAILDVCFQTLIPLLKTTLRHLTFRGVWWESVNALRFPEILQQLGNSIQHLHLQAQHSTSGVVYFSQVVHPCCQQDCSLPLLLECNNGFL